MRKSFWKANTEAYTLITAQKKPGIYFLETGLFKMKRIHLLVPVIFLLLPSVAHVIDIHRGQGFTYKSKAPDFQLEDKDGGQYHLYAMKSDYIILIFFNKRQKSDAVASAAELSNTYSNIGTVSILLIADMRNIPPFITKEFVKSSSRREQTPVPVLFDWNQSVNSLYYVNPLFVNYFLTRASRNQEEEEEEERTPTAQDWRDCLRMRRMGTSRKSCYFILCIMREAPDFFA